MQNHLGYASHARTDSSDNARNGYSEKTIKTTVGKIPIHVPRERQGSFADLLKNDLHKLLDTPEL